MKELVPALQKDSELSMQQLRAILAETTKKPIDVKSISQKSLSLLNQDSMFEIKNLLMEKLKANSPISNYIKSQVAIQNPSIKPLLFLVDLLPNIFKASDNLETILENTKGLEIARGALNLINNITLDNNDIIQKISDEKSISINDYIREEFLKTEVKEALVQQVEKFLPDQFPDPTPEQNRNLDLIMKPNNITFAVDTIPMLLSSSRKIEYVAEQLIENNVIEAIKKSAEILIENHDLNQHLSSNAIAAAEISTAIASLYPSNTLKNINCDPEIILISSVILENFNKKEVQKQTMDLLHGIQTNNLAEIIENTRSLILETNSMGPELLALIKEKNLEDKISSFITTTIINQAITSQDLILNSWMDEFVNHYAKDTEVQDIISRNAEDQMSFQNFQADRKLLQKYRNEMNNAKDLLRNMAHYKFDIDRFSGKESLKHIISNALGLDASIVSENIIQLIDNYQDALSNPRKSTSFEEFKSGFEVQIKKEEIIFEDSFKKFQTLYLDTLQKNISLQQKDNPHYLAILLHDMTKATLHDIEKGASSLNPVLNRIIKLQRNQEEEQIEWLEGIKENQSVELIQLQQEINQLKKQLLLAETMQIQEKLDKNMFNKSQQHYNKECLVQMIDNILLEKPLNSMNYKKRFKNMILNHLYTILLNKISSVSQEELLNI